MNNIDDLLLGVLGALVGLLSRGVGTSVYNVVNSWCSVYDHGGVEKRTELLSSNSDHPAIGLIRNAVDLLDIVRVGDDLVIGENVLQHRVSKAWPVNVRFVALKAGAIAVPWEQGGVFAQRAWAGTHLVDNHSGGCVFVK